jgi:hypothetical protein
MTRYYFNENPQVELWKEKAITIKSLFDQYRSVAEKYNESIVNALNDLTDEVRRFNSLPWYKKMFYKFRL